MLSVACVNNACQHANNNAPCSDGSVCTSDSCSLGACAHAPSGLCRITGTVRYYRNSGSGGSEPSAKPVPGAPIDGTQDALPDAVSDGDGGYTLENQAGAVVVRALGKYSVPRAVDNGAVTSFDAVIIARAAVSEIVLSANQRIAADVTGNGQVTSFDASCVAQYAVQLINHFDVAEANVSDWSFVRCDTYESATSQNCGPPEYTHAPLQQSGTDDFFAILYGDVTGNWIPASSLAASADDATAERASSVLDAVTAQALRARGGAAAGRPRHRTGPAVLSLVGGSRPFAAGETRSLRVNLASADGIEALDLVLRYDPAAIVLEDVRSEGFASGFTLTTHDEAGVRRIALYGVTPLEGSGTALVITVRALRAGGGDGGEPLLRLQGQANEGRIPMSVPKPTPGENGRKTSR
jgi:hypothetical protein